MVKYRFQIYPYSGQMFTNVNSVTGHCIDAVGHLPNDSGDYYEDNDGYNTTDFIPINPDCSVIRIVCPVSGTPKYPYVAFYSDADYSTCLSRQALVPPRQYYDEIAGQWVEISFVPGSTVDKRVYFTTSAAYMQIARGARYIRVSADAAQFSSLSIQFFGSYGLLNTTPRTTVNPIYKEDLSFSYEKEGKNRFLRRKLGGNLTFILSDFDAIMSYNWQTRIRLVIQKSTDQGQTYSDYWEGEFARTDCAITYDDRKIVVTPDVADVYDNFIAKYEDEHNLIDLAPDSVNVQYLQRPCLQIYPYLTGSVQNVAGGMAWETEIDDPDSESGATNRGFVEIGNRTEFDFTAAALTAAGASGRYTGTLPDSVQSVGREQICFSMQQVVASGNAACYMEAFIVPQPGGEPTFEYRFYSATGAPIATYAWGWNNGIHNMNVGNTRSQAGLTAECVAKTKVFARYLTNNPAYSANRITSVDPFVDTENNYLYYYTPNSTDGTLAPLQNIMIDSSRYTTSPTIYGRVTQSVEEAHGNVKLYYMPPDDFAYYIPLSKMTWGAVSHWMDGGSVLAAMSASFIGSHLNNTVILRDAYDFASCIERLAQQIDPRLTFKATDTYSRFFYAAVNPVIGQGIANPYRHLCITQITNISRGEYTQAAQRGDAALKWFMDLVKNVFNCLWWVDEQYRIHIEHISYFDNGGSYNTGTQAIGKDITALYNSRNSLPWSYSLDECTFEKDEVATRYQTEWALGARDLFNGRAIDILNGGADKSSKEEVSVSHFAADLDYIIGSPSEFSKDGWIILATNTSPYGREPLLTTITGVSFDNLKDSAGQTISFPTQNGRLSFAYLQPYFWLYGLSGTRVSCNGNIVTATSLARLQTQKVTLPYEDGEIETDKLIRTSVGDGQIKRAEFNLLSRTATLTLIYPVQ